MNTTILSKMHYFIKMPINSKALRERVKKHFSRYPKNFELWLFLDNHRLRSNSLLLQRG